MQILQLYGVQIFVQRKPIKNIYLRVSMDGKVKITAPYSIDEQQLFAFVKAKWQWVVQKKKIIACKQASLLIKRGKHICCLASDYICSY